MSSTLVWQVSKFSWSPILNSLMELLTMRQVSSFELDFDSLLRFHKVVACMFSWFLIKRAPMHATHVCRMYICTCSTYIVVVNMMMTWPEREPRFVKCSKSSRINLIIYDPLWLLTIEINQKDSDWMEFIASMREQVSRGRESINRSLLLLSWMSH